MAVGRAFDRCECRRGEVKGEIGAGVFAIEEGVDVDSVGLGMVVMMVLGWWWLWWVPALTVPPRSRTRGWVCISWERRWVASVFTERAGAVVS